MLRGQPGSTRTYTLFPYTTLFRAKVQLGSERQAVRGRARTARGGRFTGSGRRPGPHGSLGGFVTAVSGGAAPAPEERRSQAASQDDCRTGRDFEQKEEDVEQPLHHIRNRHLNEPRPVLCAPPSYHCNVSLLLHRRRAEVTQIGRASCRERVCQYG